MKDKPEAPVGSVLVMLHETPEGSTFALIQLLTMLQENVLETHKTDPAAADALVQRAHVLAETIWNLPAFRDCDDNIVRSMALVNVLSILANGFQATVNEAISNPAAVGDVELAEMSEQDFHKA